MPGYIHPRVFQEGPGPGKLQPWLTAGPHVPVSHTAVLAGSKGHRPLLKRRTEGWCPDPGVLSVRGGLWGRGHAHSSSSCVCCGHHFSREARWAPAPRHGIHSGAAGCWGGVVGETVLGGWVSRAVPGVGGGEGGCSSFSLGAPAHSRLLSTQPITPTLGQPANHAHTGPASQEVGTLTAQTFRCAGHPSGLRSGYPVP